MRETHQSYAGDSAFQFALREMQDGFSSLRQWAVLAAVILLLGISGPFDTLSTFGLPMRLAYWASTVLSCFTIGNFAASLCRIWLIRAGLRQPWRFIVTGLAAGIPAGTASFAINALSFGEGMLNISGFLTVLGYATFIAIIVSGLFTLFLSAETEEKQAADGTGDGHRLIRRLDFNIRGALVSLSVADHYVEVTTTKGKQLLLMRLRDAMEESAPVAGLQIHRSHWVALDQVDRIHRENNRVMVETTVGDRLPVSRSYLADLRAAGLLT